MAERRRLSAPVRAPVSAGSSVSAAAWMGMPGQTRRCRRDGVEDCWVAAPRTANDDERWVGKAHGGGEDCTDSLAQDLA